MRTEVKNQIEMLANDVATEVPARRDTHRRWLRLGPSDSGILLLEVEVPVGVDPTEWPEREEDYLVVSRETFSSLNAALETLAQRGVDTDAFDPIWASDNPF